MGRKDIERYPKMNPAGTRAYGTGALGSLALGAMAAGAFAGGAVAIGALAIRHLAIRRLAIKRGRIGHLSIGDLEVDRLRVGELVVGSRREPHPFDDLEGYEYARLTTFRRSGEAVHTTVWFAISDGRLYVTTPPDSGKMKRIRNNPRVMLVPSNAVGKPIGEPGGDGIEGLAQRLEEDEAPELAIRTFKNKYGLKLSAARQIIGGILGEEGIGRLTLEVRPVDEPKVSGGKEQA